MNDAQNHDSQQGMEFKDSKNQPRRQTNEQASRQAYLESGGDQGNQDEISLAELWLKAKSVIAYLWKFKFLIMGRGRVANHCESWIACERWRTGAIRSSKRFAVVRRMARILSKNKVSIK